MKNLIFFIILTASITHSMEKDHMTSSSFPQAQQLTPYDNSKEFDCCLTMSLGLRIVGLAAKLAVCKPVVKFCEFADSHDKAD